jgi:DHA1 family tetracycline resistance protein-like MFS transporter
MLIAVYSLMQFLWAPALGALSDRFGRRPVLLVSLAGAVADNLVMAVAPVLGLFYVGRVLAGVTGANVAVANAYVTDVTAPADRARRFAQLNAWMGVGFVAGPVLGGWLGLTSLRAPFLGAAVLNLLNLLLALFVLPESHGPRPGKLSLPALNPLASLRGAFAVRTAGPLLTVYGVLSIIGQIGAVLWVIHGSDRYGWDSRMVGFSLASFGILHALLQATATGLLARKLGERRALLLSMLVDATGYVMLALASSGWMALAAIPVLCLGGIGPPLLQSQISATVAEERQGELQGVLASLASLAGIVTPVAIGSLYAATVRSSPGWAWVAGPLLYVPCLLLTAVRTRSSAQLAELREA